MTWAGLPAPSRTDSSPSPCDAAFPAPDGNSLLCIDAHAAWVEDRAASGWTERWRVALPDHPGGPLRTARFDGTTAWLLHHLNALDVVRDGQVVRTHPPVFRILEFAGEAGPYLRDNTRVGHLAPNGDIRWGPDACERIEDAWTDGSDWAAVCPDAIVLGDFDDVRTRKPLAHPPSAVTRVGDAWVVATFDGHLLAESNGWAAEPAGVGAIFGLFPMADRLVVQGEDLTPRVFDPASGVFLGRLPVRGRIAVDPASRTVTIASERVDRWQIPADTAPARFTRGGGGGLPFLDLEGTTLLSGNSTGDVMTWDVRDGRYQSLAAGCGNVAKTGTLIDGLAVVVQLGCTPASRTFDIATGGVVDAFAPGHLRFSRRWTDRVVGSTYGTALAVQRSGEPLELVEGSFATAATADDALWLLSREGEIGPVHDGAFVPRFARDGVSALAATDTQLWLVADDRLVATDFDGTELASWRAPRPLTVVAATRDLVVTGDLDGRIHVLSADATLLATARGHTRRVSAIRIQDDAFYSASWDATARRWSLAPALAPIEDLVGAADRWHLPVEDVLQLPTP